MKLFVEISPSGALTVRPEGVVGPGCKDFTKPFEGLGELLKSEDLPELYEGKEKQCEFN